MPPLPLRFVLIIAALLAGGCASNSGLSRVMIHGTITVPAASGAVALAPTTPGPGFSIALPEDPAASAKTGALSIVQGGAEGPAALAVPPLMLIGGVVGAALGTTEAEAQAGAAAITAALAGTRMHDAVGRALVEQLQTQESSLPGVLIRAHLRFQGLREREDFSPGDDTAAPVRQNPGNSKPSPYGTPSAQRRNRGTVNPPLALVFIVSVSAERRTDHAALGTITVEYESVPRTFATWAANDAKLIRLELAEAQRELTEALLVNATRAAAPAPVAPPPANLR